MHLALAQVEIRVVVGEDAGETLDDASHLDSIDDFGHGVPHEGVGKLVGW